MAAMADPIRSYLAGFVRSTALAKGGGPWRGKGVRQDCSCQDDFRVRLLNQMRNSEKLPCAIFEVFELRQSLIGKQNL